MTGVLGQVDGILRATDRTAAGDWQRTLLRLLAFVALGGALYGAIMGTFGGVAGERLWQVAYAALKVPLLLLVTFLVGLPSFFVLNTLLGVREDFGAALRALLAAQAGLAIVLAALSPYVVVWYASFADYEAAILFNGLLFAGASVAGQGLLRVHYRPLIERNQRHRVLLRLWIVIYVFVGVQMAWVLRPFVGSPGMPVQFFREESWGNAYVVVARLIWRAVAG